MSRICRHRRIADPPRHTWDPRASHSTGFDASATVCSVLPPPVVATNRHAGDGSGGLGEQS